MLPSPRRFAGLLSLTFLVGAGLATPAAEPTVFPKDARQRFDQADELRKKQQFSDAVKAFDEAIKLGMDKYPRAFLYRADASRGLKNYDSAIKQYSEFIERFGIEESCRY